MARIEIGDRKITANEGLVVHPPKKYDISDREEYRLGLVKVTKCLSCYCNRLQSLLSPY